MNYISINSYYVANTQEDPHERHLWRVNDMESEVPRLQECLTCHLNYSVPECQHFTPYMGPDNFNQVGTQCFDRIMFFVLKIILKYVDNHFINNFFVKGNSSL